MSTTSDPDKNLQHAIDKIHQASARGAQIVCLPELFQTQYFCQREDAQSVRPGSAHSRPGHKPAGRAGEATAHRPDRLAIREARAGRVSQHRRPLRRGRNSARPLSQDAHSRRPALLREVLLHSRRSRLPRLRHQLSAAWARWSAGTSGIPKARASPRCKAPRFCSIPRRSAGIPSEKAEFGNAQHDAWRTIQRAHAIANGVYVAVVNRVGHETGDIRGNAAPGDGLEFWGASFLCDPFGRVIAEASHDKEEILIGEVDFRSDRRHPPQLAFPARPPHRQLRPNHQQDDRLTSNHHKPCRDGSQTRPGRAKLAKPLLCYHLHP